MPIKHLNQTDLAARWNVSPRTLERWRWARKGPAYIKLGSRVVYRLVDIEAHEERRRQQALAQMASIRTTEKAAAGAVQ